MTHHSSTASSARIIHHRWVPIAHHVKFWSPNGKHLTKYWIILLDIISVIISLASHTIQARFPELYFSQSEFRKRALKDKQQPHTLLRNNICNVKRNRVTVGGRKLFATTKTPWIQKRTIDGIPHKAYFGFANLIYDLLDGIVGPAKQRPSRDYCSSTLSECQKAHKRIDGTMPQRHWPETPYRMWKCLENSGER